MKNILLLIKKIVIFPFWISNYLYFFLLEESVRIYRTFFLNYTDKFEYPKGSDLLLAFIFVFYIFLSRKKFSQNSLIIFLLVGAMYAPLFMVKSRSAFLSVLIFSIIVFPKFKKKILKSSTSIFMYLFCFH